MKEIIIMKKIIHWFMKEMFVKKRDIRSNADFIPLVNRQVLSKIRKLFIIVHKFGKKEDKHYLLFNCERADVGSLEYSTWFITVKSDINNACQILLG